MRPFRGCGLVTAAGGTCCYFVVLVLQVCSASPVSGCRYSQSQTLLVILIPLLYLYLRLGPQPVRLIDSESFPRPAGPRLPLPMPVSCHDPIHR